MADPRALVTGQARPPIRIDPETLRRLDALAPPEPPPDLLLRSEDAPWRQYDTTGTPVPAPEHAPTVTVGSMWRGLTGAPAAVVAAGAGALADHPGDLAAAGRAGYDALTQVPDAFFGHELPSLSGELRQRANVPIHPAAAFAMDTMGDPALYSLSGGGPVEGALKLGVTGAEAVPGLARRASGLARDAITAARESPALQRAGSLGRELLVDETGAMPIPSWGRRGASGPPAPPYGPLSEEATIEAADASARRDRALEALRQRWPQTARVLARNPDWPVPLKGANRSLDKVFNRMADQVYDATVNQGGVTMQPFTGEVQIGGDLVGQKNTGAMVGRYSNQSGKTFKVPLADFKPAHVRAFMEQHAKELAKNPNAYVGGWVEDGTVYLDVSQKAPNVRTATKLGEVQKQPASVVRDPVTGAWPKAQHAVYDLKNDSFPPVGNFADFVNSEEFQQRLADMYQAGVPVMNGKEWWDLHGGPLEAVYGPENTKTIAGYLAATSGGTAPVHNLRAATEYMRRHIKGEPVIQPDFRIPETAVGSHKDAMGAMTPGDFNAPGTLMPMEQTRRPNLRRAAAGRGEAIQKDKMNDMYFALLGEPRAVMDRRYAKLGEDWDRGIYVASQKDKVPGGMGSPNVSPYALLENAVRTGAQRHNMSLGRFSAYVWEGIGDTIKKTGQLYGMKHPAHTIPEASQGFGGIFEDMVAEKARKWGISVDEFKARLRSGDAELLTAILSTPVGLAALHQWQSGSEDRPQY